MQVQFHTSGQKRVYSFPQHPAGVLTMFLFIYEHLIFCMHLFAFFTSPKAEQPSLS